MSQNQRECVMSRNEQAIAAFVCKGPMSPGIRAARVNWYRQENGFFLELPARNSALPTPHCLPGETHFGLLTSRIVR